MIARFHDAALAGLDAWITRGPAELPPCPSRCGGECDPEREDGLCLDCRPSEDPDAELTAALLADPDYLAACDAARWSACEALDAETGDDSLPSFPRGLEGEPGEAVLDGEVWAAERAAVERQAERRVRRRALVR